LFLQSDHLFSVPFSDLKEPGYKEDLNHQKQSPRHENLVDLKHGLNVLTEELSHESPKTVYSFQKAQDLYPTLWVVGHQIREDGNQNEGFAYAY
jgi:hypothetical protein